MDWAGLERQLRAELPKRHLAEFVRAFWHVVEPTTALVWNWHLDAVCEHLEAVSHGLIPRLVINIPPGHMKSLLVSVFWPAWVWTWKPGWRAIFASYSHELATRDSVRCRTVVDSDKYREWFRRGKWDLSDDQNRKDYFQNTRGGVRMSTSVGGIAVGFRGDAVVVDDPINSTDVRSEVERANAIYWWDKAMSSRLNDMRAGARVIIMQRLHEDDLTGHVLRQGGYEHLCLPSEFAPKRRSNTCDGAWVDPRVEEGELLFSEMFPPEVLARAKVDLGSDGYAGQHDQLPFPADGGILKSHWWRYWLEPPRCETYIQSWDLAFKGKATSDYVVGQVWGRSKSSYYLVDQIRGRFDFPRTLEAVKELSKRHPQATLKLVEDSANGPAVIAALRDKVEGLVALPARLIGAGDSSKQARAAAVSPLIEAGNVYLPSPQLHPWVTDLVGECTAFPSGKHDDQVDALTQALARLKAAGGSVVPMSGGGGWQKDEL